VEKIRTEVFTDIILSKIVTTHKVVKGEIKLQSSVTQNYAEVD